MILEASGHKVHLVHDGFAALEGVLSFRPHVVLLDLGLPGLDGYEVARYLRKLPELKETLLVALTGYGQPEIRQLAKEAGFDEHLVKPVDFQTLNTLLSRAVPDQEE
jgi:CheY-like chemotaxis protein